MPSKQFFTNILLFEPVSILLLYDGWFFRFLLVHCYFFCKPSQFHQMCPHSCLPETVYLAYFLSVCVPAAPPHCHQSPFLLKIQTCISFFSLYLLELTYCVSNVWLSACQDNIFIIMQGRINKMLTLKF